MSERPNVVHVQGGGKILFRRDAEGNTIGISWDGPPPPAAQETHRLLGVLALKLDAVLGALQDAPDDDRALVRAIGKQVAADVVPVIEQLARKQEAAVRAVSDGVQGRLQAIAAAAGEPVKKSPEPDRGRLVLARRAG